MLFGLLVLVILSVIAQSSELSGTIKDQHGTGVPNAWIELRNQSTGARDKKKTNKNGSFKFRAVKPGLYQATIQAQGFKTLTRDAIRVGNEEEGWLEIVLQTL